MTTRHAFCARGDDRTVCNQDTGIVGNDPSGTNCPACWVALSILACPLGGTCVCTGSTECDSCGCGPCECDNCDDCGCDPCECGDDEVYDCGCGGPCSCGDCWDCHYDVGCNCDECEERGHDARFSEWSDRYVWRQVFLKEGDLHDWDKIMEAVCRVKNYNYATVRRHDGTFGPNQERHYDTIMEGFREHWRNQT